MPIQLKRIYEEPSDDDGLWILVERLWPRGIAKTAAALDMWVKDAAPSAELRNWFQHDPVKWEEFKKLYYKELDSKHDIANELINLSKKNKTTFVFASKETQLNNAVALKQYIEIQLKLKTAVLIFTKIAPDN